MGWHDTNYDPRVDGYARDYGYTPDPSEFAEEEFERRRKQDYPRGYGPPYDGEGDLDPDLENLEETEDPERFLHPDDFTHSPSAEPFDTPIYHPRTPGADYPEDTDPAEWEDREEERAHEEHRGHFGGILTQRDQWPDRYAANNVCPECGGSKGYCICPHGAPAGHGAQDIINNELARDHHQRMRDDEKWNDHLAAYPRDPRHEAYGNGLDPDKEEWLYNRDPWLGTTVPEPLHQDKPGAVSIRPPDEAKPGDAIILHPEVTGLEYPVVARWNDDHSSWDILKPLA